MADESTVAAAIIEVGVDGTNAIAGSKKIADALESIEKRTKMLAKAEADYAASADKSAKVREAAAKSLATQREMMVNAEKKYAKALEENAQRRAKAAQKAEADANKEAEAVKRKADKVISEEDRIAKEVGRIRAKLVRDTAAAQASAGGGTQYEYNRALIALKGFDPDSPQFKPDLDRLKKFSEIAGRGALTARELAFATRGLPAQFTDIAVSLQGGQNPMTVLLQQGGQLKDMFGGVGNAARAMGGYVASLVNHHAPVLAPACHVWIVQAPKLKQPAGDKLYAPFL
jgi:phage-related minor tail protein